MSLTGAGSWIQLPAEPARRNAEVQVITLRVNSKLPRGLRILLSSTTRKCRQRRSWLKIRVGRHGAPHDRCPWGTGLGPGPGRAGGSVSAVESYVTSTHGSSKYFNCRSRVDPTRWRSWHVYVRPSSTRRRQLSCLSLCYCVISLDHLFTVLSTDRCGETARRCILFTKVVTRLKTTEFLKLNIFAKFNQNRNLLFEKLQRTS